jgi:hypothetical protein
MSIVLFTAFSASAAAQYKGYVDTDEVTAKEIEDAKGKQIGKEIDKETAAVLQAEVSFKLKYELKSVMRVLWAQHVSLTRMYIISALAGIDDAGKGLDRLNVNAEDVGTSIKPYYGADNMNKLTALLKEHIKILMEVVRDSKDGKKDDLGTAQNNWRANASTIADFLAGLNSNFSKTDMNEMLLRHIDFATMEINSRINKDWDADISAYDKGQEHMLDFADALTSGIIKQFPDKFNKCEIQEK